MSLMDVFVKIGADTSGLESGISKAKGLAGGLGSAIGTGMKVVGAAIGTATAAVGAFAASSVEVGKNFDSSMSQVAATMGKTVDEIGELRDFAQEMGRTTAFSATQAADALNYMALAGYDADKSMEMLPNVLNLAAAGNMELATASDMVTDAQSALGLSMEETTELVDMMAKTSSKSNTSVQQLGDAILTIGGTAKTLAGGTTELNAALGILADNGIKGAEGGTKLRNVVLSLSAPTDKAAQMLEGLGVQAVDAEGNMKPLEDIMGDLSGALDGLGTAEKAEIINTIFNKQDIAAVNALLDTSADRWDELSVAIDDSKGAAEAMAETQLDNLEGDITLFKSALEGVQIMISDALTPTLREFVKFGTDGLTKLGDAFKEGGIEGAMDAFGEILSDGIAMITEKIPEMIKAGIKLLGALGQGLIDNLDVILDAAKVIVTEIGTALIAAAPELLNGAIEILSSLGSFLIEQIPVMIPAIVNLINNFVNILIDNASAMIDGAVALITGLSLALIENAPKLIPAILQLVVAIAQAMIENLPVLVEAVIQINIALVQAIIENAPLFLNALVQIVTSLLNLLVEYGGKFVEWVAKNGAEMLNTFVQWLSQLPTQLAYWAGFAIGAFIKFFAELPTKIKEIFSRFLDNVRTFGSNLKARAPEIANGFKTSLIKGVEDLPSKFLEIGKNIVEGIWEGISAGWSWLTESVKNLADSLLKGVKDALKIGSPSKVFANEVGKWIPAGIAVGIKDGIPAIDEATAQMNTKLISDSPILENVSASSSSMTSISDSVYNLLATYLPVIADKDSVDVVLEGDADRLFRVVQSQSRRNKQITGQESFA